MSSSAHSTVSPVPLGSTHMLTPTHASPPDVPHLLTSLRYGERTFCPLTPNRLQQANTQHNSFNCGAHGPQRRPRPEQLEHSCRWQSVMTPKFTYTKQTQFPYVKFYRMSCNCAPQTGWRRPALPFALRLARSRVIIGDDAKRTSFD